MVKSRVTSELLPCTDIHFNKKAHILNIGVCQWRRKRRKFSWGGVIQWLVVVICIWYGLFVTSHLGVIFMFPTERFDDVC